MNVIRIEATIGTCCTQQIEHNKHLPQFFDYNSNLIYHHISLLFVAVALLCEGSTATKPPTTTMQDLILRTSLTNKNFLATYYIQKD